MKKLFFVLIFLGAAGMFFLGASKAADYRNSYGPRFPPPSAIKEIRKSGVEDILALSFGMRRLFADLWFIRLMQYYGTRGICEGEETDEHVHCHHGADFGTGDYPEFVPLARHIAALDPYFKNAILYAAGSLAFNMNRPDEAEALLNYALGNTPREWKFLTVLAAIGYSKSREPVKVAEIITPLVREHDCPVMLKQLAAFLNKTTGNYTEAIAVYKDILNTSKDPFYTANAKKELAKLTKPGAGGKK